MFPASGTAPPDALARPGRQFYYGWVIVVVMAVTGAVSMGLGGLNFGLLIKPIGDDLGIGRATFGWALSGRQVASAVTAPLVGGLLDRFGARIMLAVAALLMGGALSAFWFVTEGWEIILLFGLTGLVGLNGPGALVTSVPVTRWFVRKRGKALAMTSLGVPLGGFLFGPLTQVFIDLYGWRVACVLLGVIGAAIIVPLSSSLCAVSRRIWACFRSALRQPHRDRPARPQGGSGAWNTTPPRSTPGPALRRSGPTRSGGWSSCSAW
jgi:MFS family permease